MMIHVAPGDPVTLLVPDYASPEDIARVKAHLGLDRPLPEQFFRYAMNALRGDFGQSVRSNRPVIMELSERMPATIELAVASGLIGVGLGIPLGVTAALHRNTSMDRASMFAALLWVGMPGFYLALLLQIFLAYGLGVFPLAGRESEVLTFAWLRSIALPAFSLGAPSAGILARMTRSSVLEVLGSDYVRTARAKGLSETIVVYKHALRNALIPIVTLVGLQWGTLLGGAFITETIFAWPGLGRLGVTAIFNRDVPQVQGVVLLVAAAFIAVNITTDIAYGVLDPRVRYD
jgi:ABC-type dipeptide/oligopeptide/nickel transport system permease component